MSSHPGRLTRPGPRKIKPNPELDRWFDNLRRVDAIRHSAYRAPRANIRRLAGENI